MNKNLERDLMIETLAQYDIKDNQTLRKMLGVIEDYIEAHQYNYPYDVILDAQNRLFDFWLNP